MIIINMTNEIQNEQNLSGNVIKLTHLPDKQDSFTDNNQTILEQPIVDDLKTPKNGVGNDTEAFINQLPSVDSWSNASDDWGSEKHSSYGRLSFLEESLPLIEIQPTENEKELSQNFYKEIKDVGEQNVQEYQESLYDPSVNYCIENAFENEEDEEYSSCGSLSFLGESSPLIEIQPTINEKRLIQRFYEEIKGVRKQNVQEYQKSLSDLSVNYCIENALERIKGVADKYLEQGLRLSLRCSDDDSDKTIASLILGEIEDIFLKKSCSSPTYRISKSSGILYREDYYNDSELSEKSFEIVKYIICELVLHGGKIGYDFYHTNGMMEQEISKFEDDLDAECKKVRKNLKELAYESIINKSKQIQNRLEVERDNKHLYIKYVQGSVVELARITSNQKIKNLGLETFVLQIGKSTVTIESAQGKRNYTDVSDSIEMSFFTQADKINIHLHPGKGNNSNKIEVEFADEESKARFDKLEDEEKKSLGPNFLLRGESVAEAINKSLKRSSSVLAKLTEAIIEQPKVGIALGTLILD